MPNNKEIGSYHHPEYYGSYDLRHCFCFETKFNVKLRESNSLKPVNCRVYISNHCFTEKLKSEEISSDIYYQERKKDGSIETRVFSESRWEFSKKIPLIISNLEHKGCLGGNRKRILYRQEEPKYPGAHSGWYICMTLNYSLKKGLELRITSCHYRYNRPVDIRTNGPRKFYLFLNEFMDGKI